MSKMLVLWIACVLPLIGGMFGAETSTKDQVKDESKAAFERTQQLYITLRNIAYPEKPLDPNTRIGSRFVLNMPGKVLNYFDYYPGLEYTKFIQDYNTKRKESVVPPHVMEKWFDLADAIPSSNPLNGQDTGKSLASTYASILHEIRIKGLDHTADKLTSIYQHAINFLVEQVIDPEVPEKNATRLGLYERFRDQYNDRKLEMEDTIEDKRLNLGGLDYELWFQRHYPSLNAKVESAYTKWMVFGQKEMVELYLADMDTGSSGQLIEQARMALRAAGVQSLDRTRTIYPVSFEPSDWYKYLLPKLQRPSRDQLLQMIGTVSSKIQAIDAMKSTIQSLDNTSPIVVASEGLKNAYDSSQTSLKNNITEYMNSQYLCMAADTDQKKEVCQNYHSNETEALLAIEIDSQIFMDYQANVYISRSEYITKLNEQKTSLEAQQTRLYALLGEASPYVGGLLDAEPLAVANISDAYKDDQWLKFEFDSEQYHQYKEFEATQESVTANMGFHVLFFSVGGTYSHSKNTEYHNDQLAQSQMKAKGELLRVTIKRPWFKPEIFDDPNLTYKESDGFTDAYVSPGRLPEDDFYQTLLQDNVHYKLPEYATAFLLARDIELEFSGLDSKTVSYAMQEQSHYEGHGGFLFFHAGVSVSKGKQTSQVTVDRTADGMRVKIPGAQVIGYYTEVVPRFPVNTP